MDRVKSDDEKERVQCGCRFSRFRSEKSKVRRAEGSKVRGDRTGRRPAGRKALGSPYCTHRRHFCTLNVEETRKLVFADILAHFGSCCSLALIITRGHFIFAVFFVEKTINLSQTMEQMTPGNEMQSDLLN